MRTVLFTRLLFIATSSHATLTSLDDRVYGPGVIILNTDTDSCGRVVLSQHARSCCSWASV